MDVKQVLDNIQELSDLELALLLSLVAHGHCLVNVDEELIDDLASELSLIASERFGLSHVVLEPGDFASTELFGEAILEKSNAPIQIAEDLERGLLQARLASLDIRGAQKLGIRQNTALDDRVVKNVVIAKGFNLASPTVQVQALELINKRRFTSHTAVHVTQKSFLFIPIVVTSDRLVPLIPHLNDKIFISHTHLPEYGFAYLEDLNASMSSKNSSTSSRLQPSWQSIGENRCIDKDVIEQIRTMGKATNITPEIRRYLQDIATFLRLERGVGGGITPRASTEFLAMAKYLAPLHGITFVTPSLVALAARKIYAHRITMVEPARERSLQYGSEPDIVTDLLQEMTPEDAIEAVLNLVPCPK